MKPTFQYMRNRFIDESERIFLIESAMNDGAVPHNHQFFEIVYIRCGKGLHLLNDATFQVSSGDLFVIKPEDTHAILPLTDSRQPFEWVNVLFLPEFIDFDIAPLASKQKYLGTDGFEVDFILRTMYREFKEKQFGYLEKLRGYLSVLLTEMVRLTGQGMEKTDYGDIRKRELVKQAAAWIKEEFQQPIRLEEAASRLGISASYLSKLFRQRFGVSFVQFLNRHRLEVSCGLLQTTRTPIRHIALDCGFSDEKYYRLYFQRLMGMSPGAYRRKFSTKALET